MPVEANWRFGGTYSVSSELKNKRSVKPVWSRYKVEFHTIILQTWRWKRHVHPKRRSTISGLPEERSLKNIISSRSFIQKWNLFPHVKGRNRLQVFWKRVKVKLFLCLITWALSHEDVWGCGVVAPSFLTSALDGSEWSTLFPCRFTPGESAPATFWIEGRVGLRISLDAVKKREI
jgi:hypothetical protein